MSTTDKLRLILNTKNEIRSAIESKGVSVSDSDSFRSYVNKISSIPQIRYDEHAVRFFDYNGDLLHVFSISEINNLTNLPALPSHEGLTCQGWNWTLTDIKNTVAEYGKCDVGAIYTTNDGKTRLYVNISSKYRKNLPLRFHQTVANGVSINWGDGSEETTISSTGSISTHHTYSNVGEYVITLSISDDCTVKLGAGNASGNNIVGTYQSNEASYSSMLTKVEIGNNVTEITEYCFYWCANITSISIPNSVSSLQSNAFGYCGALKHLNVPNGITTLPSKVFEGNYNIKNIILPNSIVSIGNNTFNQNYSLEAIRIQNVNIIPAACFKTCYHLKSVNLSKNLTAIEDEAFAYTYALQEINIYDNVSTLGQSVFRGSSIKEITIPIGVTIIKPYTFADSKLTKITLPDGLETISGYAFQSCKDLQEVVIPNSVHTIGTYVFSECAALLKVVLSNLTTSIPSYMFNNCSSLIEIELPASITSIGNYAFYNCSKLRSINIPSTVISIGTYAFSGCTCLTDVNIPVISLNNYTFDGCRGAGVFDLTDYGYIPAYATNLFANTASDCKILVSSHLYERWVNTSSWSSVKSKIATGYTLSNVASFNLDAENLRWGNTAYTPCDFTCTVYGTNYDKNSEIKQFIVKDVDTYVGMNKTESSVSKNVTFEYAGETFNTTITQGPYIENAILCKYNVTSTTSATTLLYSSFNNISYFSSMFIDGNEVGVSKTYTFSSTGTHEVIFKIAEGVKLETPYRMFYGCSNLTYVDLSSVDMSAATSTSNSAGTAYMFYNCSNLKTIILPETVSYLGYYMFYNCVNVESFTIKAKVAPTLYGSYTWGTGGYYIGYNKRANGTNKFYTPKEATGYDSSTWTSYLYNTGYCGFTKQSPYLKVECTDLSITADNVSGKFTHTTIRWTATVSCIDQTTDDVIEVVLSGTDASAEFPQNTSYTESIERSVSYTYMGVTVSTTFTHLPMSIYTIDLNDQWRLSTSVNNPNQSLYDGVYESYSNYNVNSGVATMYIDIKGYSTFKMYIRSYGESNYDYVMVSQLDQAITGGTSYSNTTLVKAHTYGKSISGTNISNYTLVEFTNIEPNEHRITVVYRKDGSSHSGTDRGYVIIPIQ